MHVLETNIYLIIQNFPHDKIVLFVKRSRLNHFIIHIVTDLAWGKDVVPEIIYFFDMFLKIVVSH